MASKNKPIILSTGIAEYKDIELAVDACRRMGNNDIALLKCTSSYPAPIDEANMKMVKDLAQKFNVITGSRIIQWETLYQLLQLVLEQKLSKSTLF